MIVSQHRWFKDGRAHQELLNQVLCLLVKALRKRVLELLDLLPVCKPAKDETARDHLIDDTPQSPEIRTAAIFKVSDL